MALPLPLQLRRRPMLGEQLVGAGTAKAARKGVGPSWIGARPLPTNPRLTIAGVTRDSTGAALGNCEVELYRRRQDQSGMDFVERTVSDGSGNFSFVVGAGMLYQHVCYLAGSPDRAAVSVRTLAGA